MADTMALQEFVKPYYADKDIMHNMWHIELVQRAVEKILAAGEYDVDRECLTLAVYFHGFIYRAENAVREWMRARQYAEETIEKTVQLAWESQRSEAPESVEGKILHDAHVLEGGKSYLVVKTLITGSVRGQSLLQTLDFMKKNVPGKNKCYLPETVSLCEEMNRYAEKFYKELMENIS